jgi:histone deacetylase 1/2
MLHVPNISKNLLSVSKFAQDNNVIFEFHPYHCFVKSQGSNQVLLEGTVGADGLYQFQPFKILSHNGTSSSSSSSQNLTHNSQNNIVKCNNSSVLHNSLLVNTSSHLLDCNKAASVVHTDFTSQNCTFPSSVHCNNSSVEPSNNNTFHMWHLRLGHAHTNAVKSVLNLCKVPFTNKTTDLPCTFCSMGKSHRLHAPLSTTIYTKPFEVIHCDLWGPAPFVSYYGYNYYITFVDTFTKYTWIYFLKTKADALKAFTQFLALIQNQFQSTIKALQSDWGGEFRPFTNMLTDLGIQHRLTCPHTSHQNGTVERKHRQIVEMGLTLLSHASLPLKFWDHSFTQSVYLINRLPSSAIPQFQSPFHSLHNQYPDFTQLKVFGCLCFPHLRPCNKHKLQFRSSPCVYLGISPQHKGHKCLDSTGRIFISKDVVFHETKFPYSSLFPTSTSSSGSSSSYPANIMFPSCFDESPIVSTDSTFSESVSQSPNITPSSPITPSVTPLSAAPTN